MNNGQAAPTLSDLLATDRIVVDSDGGFVQSKRDALRVLSNLLSSASGVGNETIERLFTERERLVSTGIGEGVAIPHTAVESAERQVAALLLCPRGVPFDAVDREPVSIIFGVVGPKKAAGEHLRTLARLSRLLKDGGTRQRLMSIEDPDEAFRLIATEDRKIG